MILWVGKKILVDKTSIWNTKGLYYIGVGESFNGSDYISEKHTCLEENQIK